MLGDALETGPDRRRLWTKARADEVVSWVRLWPRRDRDQILGSRTSMSTPEPGNPARPSA